MRNGGTTRNPRSLANLRSPWRSGESGNPGGHAPGRHRPEVRLLKLLAKPETVEVAESVLNAALIRLEPWAWNLLMVPLPPPTFVDPEGYEIEPHSLEVPGTAWWGYFAERLPGVWCRGTRFAPPAICCGPSVRRGRPEGA